MNSLAGRSGRDLHWRALARVVDVVPVLALARLHTKAVVVEVRTKAVVVEVLDGSVIKNKDKLEVVHFIGGG